MKLYGEDDLKEDKRVAERLSRAFSGKGLMLHERFYLFMNAFMPRLFPVPHEPEKAVTKKFMFTVFSTWFSIALLALVFVQGLTFTGTCADCFKKVLSGENAATLQITNLCDWYVERYAQDYICLRKSGMNGTMSVKVNVTEE